MELSLSADVAGKPLLGLARVQADSIRSQKQKEERPAPKGGRTDGGGCVHHGSQGLGKQGATLGAALQEGSLPPAAPQAPGSPQSSKPRDDGQMGLGTSPEHWRTGLPAFPKFSLCHLALL